MGLIKSQNAPPTLSPFSMRDIESQAHALMARAREQAEKLLAAADGEGARIRQNAYDAGFKAGREDGLRKGTEDGLAAGKQAALTEHRARLEQVITSLTAAVSDLDTSRSRLESAAATEVIKLAVAIARRVTKLQGESDPKVLAENIREAVRLVIHSTDIRIAVNPAQKKTLEDVLPQLRMQWPNVTHVEIIEDATLAPGGCCIGTAHGQIDADLERQIDRVAADLLPGGQGAA